MTDLEQGQARPEARRLARIRSSRGEPSPATGVVENRSRIAGVRMRERRMGIQEQRVARLTFEPAAGASRGGLPNTWTGRRLKKSRPRARLRGAGSMADFVRENRR